ncbi:uroporphyrinogen-III synthase [Swingsia samuiensis]|uniref:Uroporphyrinogen-III synthase n=1 Tax=Swingsia samuiensis TaxID=1293412 RepID=A0A4Y6UMJ2_9PROT|nr:uroporphyrinogen-III synthase [Swingsia samuiensis]QDH17577.1 uroporphyrinogen-III synthase [Swingsia samuiensis]
MSSRRFVIVTRPEPGLTETMNAIRALGWVPVACPMLVIRHYLPPEEVECDVVLVTSLNALPALKNWSKRKRIITVGQKTAQRAREYGFLHVDSAGGDAKSLSQLCLQNNIVGQKVLLLSGKGYGVELAAQLKTQRLEVYDVFQNTELTEEAKNVFLNEEIAAVCFYSGRTAKAFEAALEQKYREKLKDIRAVCLSEGIAQELSSELWKEKIWPKPLEGLGPYKGS